MDLTRTVKNVLSKSELRQIKKARTRVGGKKVVTDDVKKLKSLKIIPDLPSSEKIHYYKEPIWIEYYVPKESRFAYEVKFLFVKLIDEEPRPGGIDSILEDAILNKKIVDPFAIMNQSYDLKEIISHSYRNFLTILETISFNDKQYRESGDTDYLKTSLYLTETLMKYEPTIASLEVLGQFTTHNLNWYIRELNRHSVRFSLEDETVLLLIKRRNDFWEENNLPEDSDFELFSALFIEQAFPHRGAEELSADDFLLE